MIQKRKCIICGKEFKVRTQRNKKQLLQPGYRGINCTTCSRICAKIKIRKKKK